MKTYERYISYVLVLVFPGLGHLYCGKKTSAACIAASIAPLFIAGVAIGASLAFETVNPNMMGLLGLNFIYARVVPVMASIIKMCAGAVLFFPAAAIETAYPAFFDGLSTVRVEIGTAFCLTAGLLNLLTLINLFYWHNRDLLPGAAEAMNAAAPRQPAQAEEAAK